MKDNLGQKGFTLVELILYMAIAIVVVMSVSVLLVLMLEVRTKNMVIAEVEQEGMRAMQLITQEARNSESINLPAEGNSGSELRLSMPGGGGDTIFSLSGGVLQIQEGGGGAVDLTSAQVSTSSVTFTNLTREDAPGNVEIEFTLSFNSSSSRYEYDYSKTFVDSASLRNYD